MNDIFKSLDIPIGLSNSVIELVCIVIGWNPLC